MKKILVIANWKCNPITLAEAKKLFDSVKKGIKNIRNSEIVICPPFVYLSNIQHLKSNTEFLKKARWKKKAKPSSPIKLGAQDVFWETEGAYTGEISPLMLKNSGCHYVIIGHSERRKYQKETDEMLNKKLKAVLEAGLKAILCVDNISQVKKDLIGLVKKELLNLIIAYEPLFAIGTGKSCSMEKASKMRILITRALAKGGEERMFFNKKKLNKNIPILYGGSVNSQNAVNYIRDAGFQGLLIGGASLKAKEFVNIIRNIDPVIQPPVIRRINRTP